MHSLQQLKDTVITLANKESFKHHKRYVQYHLLIVENLCTNLLPQYPKARKDIVDALVRVHDFNKICWLAHDEWVIQVRDLLSECGYEDSDIEGIITLRWLIEKKMEIDLRTTPIEVQILSSCDAASHYVWPFMAIDWRENPNLSLEDLFERGRAKMYKDFERRVTLPEVEKFLTRRKKLYEELYQWKGIEDVSFMMK